MREAVDSWSVRLAARVYRLCIFALPGPLYDGFGQDMQDDFRAIARDAHDRRGGVAVLSALLRAVLDLFGRSLGERLQLSDVAAAKLPLGERMQLLFQELRQAGRSIMKRPGFSFVAVLTLALGIGANVAIFAVVNAVLIRPLPYSESERMVWIQHHAPGLSLPDLESGVGTVMLFQKFARSYSSMAAVVDAASNLTGTAEPARVQVLRVTPALFDVMRLKPIMGRRLTEADEVRGAPDVALLTYRGWQNHFGGSPSVLGQVVRLNDRPTTMVGVLPKEFQHPDWENELVVPMHFDPNEGFGAFGIGHIARLAPGATIETAQAEATRLISRLPELYPDITPEFLKKAGWSVSVSSFRDRLVGDAKTALWVVLGTVGFLLLVACASVANLFLVRAEGRQREIAVRFALGATGPRVAATFLSESMLLGISGGFWGLVLAYWSVRALVAASPPQLPRLSEINVDLRVALFAIGIGAVAGLVFGLMPLPMHLRRSLHGLVRAGRGFVGGRERNHVRKSLIVAQIALAVVLVTGSGLMLRSFANLRAVDPGIRTDGVLTLGISLGDEVSKPVAAARYQQIVDELNALPGVQHAAATNALPLNSSGINGGSFRIQSKPREEGALPPVAMYAIITDDYLPSIGTRLVQGRAIERADHEQNRAVALVNQTFARLHLGGNAVGERLAFGEDSLTWIEVVGVVEDVRTFGLSEDVRALAYLPMTTHVPGARIGIMTAVIRTTGDPAALIGAARAAVKRAAPAAPITSARTMQQVMDRSLADTAFTMTIILIAALVALLLGAIGLYGVIGYVVSQRTQEIGVRIALGAIPAQVRTLVLRQGLVLAAGGVAIGLVAAVSLSRVLESLLFQVETRDPLVFALVPLTMLSVTALASYLPARRASNVSPLQALRSE
ncbi:MAG: ABC transporter permease [Gemmatimonadota bacterium]